MKHPDALQLVAPGSLTRPGVIGRAVRLCLGAACLYALWTVLRQADNTSALPIATLSARLWLVLAPLCIFSDVVNIGFSKNWGHRPLVAALGLLVLFALAARFVSGSLDSPLLGIPLNAWLAYSYGHLGLCFVLSALLATPGCEMRALPELLGRITGRPSPEHHCPVSFIDRIDAWERRQSSA
jgi:hypothetical protein